MITPKKIILMLGLCFGLDILTAQNWCPPGATWYYRVGFLNTISGVDGLLTFKYESDTVIQNLTCKKIRGVFEGYWYDKNYQYSSKHFYNNYFTLESNRVLYLYNAGTFDTVVNYNAKIGDTWIKSVLTNCNKKIVVTVIDTSSIYLNNRRLKNIKITFSDSVKIGWPSPNTYKKYTSTYNLTEKINYRESNREMLFVFDNLCEPDLSGANDKPIINFRCYEEDNFPTYSVSSTTCNDITGISGVETLNERFKIYPNPTSGLITVQLAQAYVIKILSMQGDVLFEQNLLEGNNKIDLTFIQKGIYFVSFSNGHTQNFVKFIKE